MASGNVRVLECTPDDVFATLADGWLYPVWVVGAARMRDVSPTWPEVGAKIHHSLGVWPILFDDETELVEWSPPRRLRLRAKAGPFGRAVVVIEVRPRAGGCIVRIGEEPVTGPARALPSFLWAPLLHARNRETLRRLAAISEGRRRERDAGEQTTRPDVPEQSAARPGPESRADAEGEKEASEAARTADAGPGLDGTGSNGTDADGSSGVFAKGSAEA